jgi:hypothetical protein
MSDLLNDTKKHTTKSREIIPLIRNFLNGKKYLSSLFNYLNKKGNVKIVRKQNKLNWYEGKIIIPNVNFLKIN